MKLISLIVVITCYSTFASASSVTIEGEREEDTYKSWFVSVGIDFAENYNLRLAYSKSQLDDEFNSSEGNIEITRYGDNGFSFGVSGTKREETDDLIGTGGGINFAYELNRWWTSEQLTLFRFEITNIYYEQKATFDGAIFNYDAARDFEQRSVYTSFEHNFTNSFLLGLEYTKYTYSDDSAIKYVNKFNSNSGKRVFDGTIGLPTESSSIFMAIYPVDWLELDFKFSRGHTEAESSEIQTFDFRPSYVGKSIKTGPYYSVSKDSDTDEKQKIVGLSFTYLF